MALGELQRLAEELTEAGYALTSYADIGLELDVVLAQQLSETALKGIFSPDAAKLTERIEKQKMTMVQDELSIKLGRQMVAPIVEALFVSNKEAVEGWDLYAMNCYQEGGGLGVHQDSVEKTVLVVTASGARRFDVYNRNEKEEAGFTQPERSFLLNVGSIMILDAEADPGHSIECIEGPSVSAVLDIPALIRY
jgi:hypothetical protein